MNITVATPSEISKKIIETNLLGTIFTNQVYAPMIKEKGWKNY